MQVGQVCSFRLGDGDDSTSPSPAPLLAWAVVVGIRPHMEDRQRRYCYLHCTHIEQSATLLQLRRKSSSLSWSGTVANTTGSGTIHSWNEMQLRHGYIASTDGYAYRCDGWYSEEQLQPATPLLVREVPEEWMASMEKDWAVCEVVYLCYAFHPWFPVEYTALQYIAPPEADVCYSVYWCHRCLSPLLSQEQYFVHLNGRYCPLQSPPGKLLYHDVEAGRKVYLVDGASHLHYGRCLSLISKHFIESKVIRNDVDIYEYVVVTMPRDALPYLPRGPCVGDGDGGVSAEAQFKRDAASFDAEEWNGDVVVGFFSRRKHQADHALSCIMTLPIFQGQRIGTFLLDVAYFMTRQRQDHCGCERCGTGGGAISRPLSPHGQGLLMHYWRQSFLRCLRKHRARLEHSAVSLAALQRLMDIPLHMDDLHFLLLHCDLAFYSLSTPLESSGGRCSNNGGELVSGHDGRDEESAPVVPLSSPACLPSSSSPLKKYRLALNRGPARAKDGAATSATTPTNTSATAQRYSAALVVEQSTLDAVEDGSGDAAESRRRPGDFDGRWLLRTPTGAYIYNASLFHY